MGPQLVRCGKAVRICLRRLSHLPSMGPQLVRCGKFAGVAVSIYYAFILQWGRNLFVAERNAYQKNPIAWDMSFNGAATCSLRKAIFSKAPYCIPVNLQWGRNLFVAESFLHSTLIGFLSQPSMGPQLVRCGKSPSSPVSTIRSPSFNGAATCSLRKVIDGYRDRINAEALQWGRNLFVAES